MKKHVIYSIILCTICLCYCQEMGSQECIHCTGKLYYNSNEMKMNDGRIDVEYNITPDGLLYDKTDYDTGSKRNPSLCKYSFHRNNAVAKKEWCSGSIVVYYEDYDEYGNIIKSIQTKEVRGFRKEESYEYRYDNKGYMTYSLKISNTFLKDKIIRTDSEQMTFTYNSDHTTRKTHFNNINSEQIIKYVYDSFGNILESTLLENDSSSRCDVYTYDVQNRITFHGVKNRINKNNKLSTYVNHWVYEYNEKNLPAKLMLYTNNVLQYTLVYTYSGIEKLKPLRISTKMITHILKNNDMCYNIYYAE
jgi:hypothetical protein